MNGKKKRSLKYIYRGLCTVILTIFAKLSFYLCWHSLVQNVVMEKMELNIYLFGMGNMGMSLLIYLVLYLTIGKVLYAFRIGVERTANIAASQALTFLVVDALEVLIFMAIAGNFRFFLSFTVAYFLLFLLQTVVAGIVVIFMIRLYRGCFPPLMILEIDGGYNNELTEKVNGLIHKYKIIKKINVDVGMGSLKPRFPIMTQY